MKKPKYEILDTQSKEERRAVIADSGVLESKRFVLTSNPELRKELNRLNELIIELMKKYPEVIGLNLHGSLVKGYANKLSDIDGYLFIDQDMVPKVPTEKIPEKMIADFSYISRRDKDIDARFEAAGLNDKLRDLVRLSIFRKEIVERCRDFPAHIYLWFLLTSTGSEKINKYRELIISTLEQLGEQGEKTWRWIMDDLWHHESVGLDNNLAEKRKTIYPQTLSDGRKYFLKSLGANSI